MVEKGDQGSEEVRQRQCRRFVRRQEFLLRADAGRLEARPQRGLRALHAERNDRRRRDLLDAEDRRCAAGRRHVVQHSVAPDRCEPVRPDLRRCAKEHRPGRPHPRHRPRRPDRTDDPGHADAVRLQGQRRQRLDVQHPANLCDLHRRSGIQAPEGEGGACRDGTDQPCQGQAAVRRARRVEFLPVAGRAGKPLADEHSVHAQGQRARRGIPQGGQGARHDSVEGAPFGRRHACFDLQRDAGRRRGNVGRPD